MISADDARCGFAAVLIVGYREWLRGRPEREQFCLDAVLSAVAVERERKWFDGPRAGTDWSWDAFCAQALPVMWAEQRDEPLLRQAIARLAFCISYTTIKRLFASAVSIRDRLGDDFCRLQHLAVHAAVYRRAADVARNRAGARLPDKAAINDRISEFLDGTLAPDVPAWAALAVPPAGSRQSWGELDTGYLQAAYAWMPPIDHARDAGERAAWVAHWQESVTELVERVRRNHEREHDDSLAVPPEDDNELLRALPARIIEMTVEEARPVWEPLLALGAIGPHWVENFLSIWFIVGMQAAPAPDSFLEKWEEMLDWVESEPGWDGAERSLETEELKRLLLGLNGLSIDLWTADQASVATRLAPHYERWAGDHLTRRDDAARFASFLRRDGATPLLPDGLVGLPTRTRRHQAGTTTTPTKIASGRSQCRRPAQSGHHSQRRPRGQRLPRVAGAACRPSGPDRAGADFADVGAGRVVIGRIGAVSFPRSPRQSDRVRIARRG